MADDDNDADDRGQKQPKDKDPDKGNTAPSQQLAAFTANPLAFQAASSMAFGSDTAKGDE